MTATTYPEFNANTESIDVAKAFSERIRGKTIVVTGGNRNGIAFSTAQAFASQSPAHLIIAGRTPSKIQESIDALKAEFPSVDYRALQINLSSQESVRSAAAEFLSWSDVPTVDILVNTAGIMCVPERTLSDEGIELHFATNHIGHWLFACLIMSKFIKASESNPIGATRIVNVSSASPMRDGMRWSDMNFEKPNKDLPKEEQPFYEWLKAWGYTDVENKPYLPLDGYARSKVANVLFGIGANKRLYSKYGILTLAVHPGIIKTELGRDFPAERLASVQALHDKGVFFYRTLGAGASTSLVAAVDPKIGLPETNEKSENHGAYLADCQISDAAHPRAVSSNEAERLWKLSEELVKQEFDW
ncbi:hypothetical protein BGZ63DRAFT_355724 [Mariannaea sp. PMI_226]|nr:hypothetical protein BGZ63DRAFT_355724 [Mariannaea sp. PMI_226]